MELEEGIDYYINETGLYVFTAHYLLKRGYCCGNGCKHCPYTEEKENEAGLENSSTKNDNK